LTSSFRKDWSARAASRGRFGAEPHRLGIRGRDERRDLGGPRKRAVDVPMDSETDAGVEDLAATSDMISPSRAAWAVPLTRSGQIHDRFSVGDVALRRRW
jgi:hypothetical protein